MALDRDTILIGASAGGLPALRQLLGALPATLPAAVLVVMHQRRGEGGLDAALRDASALPLAFVTDAEPLRAGRVYLAPPDRHMVVDGERVLVARGPREMRTRPAVNPLFRTAAATRAGRVVAVQLSGLLDDGVAGLAAVKRCGGLVLVQDPDEADYVEMPRRALEAVQVDHVASVARIAELLAELIGQPAPDVEVPEDIAIEARLSGREPSRPSTVERIGEQISMACPDCGGPLWQIGNGDEAMYRCHVGHALSARAILGAQWDDIERSLWVAVRSLNERARMLNRLGNDAGRYGAHVVEEYHRRAGEAMAHSETARRFLLSLQGEPSPHPRDDDGLQGGTETA